MTQSHVVAALQIGALPEGKAATLAHVLSFEEQIRASGAGLVVMPEALLGGYPKGESFGTYLGYRLPQGRETYARYFDNAIDVPGPEVAELAGLSARTAAHIVIGVIERAGSTLFCTALFFSPEKGLIGKHRKLMPTGTERLIWGQGDGSTLPVLDTPVGRIGAAICWENHMPLLRTALYAKGVQSRPWTRATCGNPACVTLPTKAGCFSSAHARCSPRPRPWASQRRIGKKTLPSSKAIA